MEESNMFPFVKWAGGKRQLLPYLKEHIPKNFDRYFEPFLGGGAMLLDIAPHRAIINDSNKQLINAYKQVKENVEDLIYVLSSIDAVHSDKEFYYCVRDRYNKKILNNENDLECAALLIWLNKHCFNGLYRVNNKGLFNVPYNNKQSIESTNSNNLRSISHYLSNNKIDILSDDFEVACEATQTGDFIYFDSPYIPISKTANFTDYTTKGFTYDDHIRLAKLFYRLNSNGVFLMLSNNDVPLVHELYRDFNIYYSIEARRSINSKADRRIGREVIITNY